MAFLLDCQVPLLCQELAPWVQHHALADGQFRVPARYLQAAPAPLHRWRVPPGRRSAVVAACPPCCWGHRGWSILTSRTACTSYDNRVPGARQPKPCALRRGHLFSRQHCISAEVLNNFWAQPAVAVNIRRPRPIGLRLVGTTCRGLSQTPLAVSIGFSVGAHRALD
jgi:hypothetical protein